MKIDFKKMKLFESKVDYGIELDFANMGSGKSTYCAMRAQQALRSGKYWKVYSTEPIAGCYMFSVKDDFGKKDISWCEEEGCHKPVLLLVGEGAIDFPNTSAMPEHQKAYARLLRHYHVFMIVCSQSYEDVNIVLRRLYRKQYLLNRSFLFTHVTTRKQIRKTIGIDDMTHQIIEQYHFIKWWQGGSSFFYRRKWYKYFDSYDCPRLQDVPDVQFPPVENVTFINKAKLLIDLSKYGKELTELDEQLIKEHEDSMEEAS